MCARRIPLAGKCFISWYNRKAQEPVSSPSLASVILHHSLLYRTPATMPATAQTSETSGDFPCGIGCRMQDIEVSSGIDRCSILDIGWKFCENFREPRTSADKRFSNMCCKTEFSCVGVQSVCVCKITTLVLLPQKFNTQNCGQRIIFAVLRGNVGGKGAVAAFSREIWAVGADRRL